VLGEDNASQRISMRRAACQTGDGLERANVKRSCIEQDLKHPTLPVSIARRGGAPPNGRLVETQSLECGVGLIGKTFCDVVLVRRQLCGDALECLNQYLSTKPIWPNAEHYHPLESTHERVAFIDFSGVSSDTADPLSAAVAMGQNLPRRSAGAVANAYRGVAEVVSVLPAGLGRDLVTQDAEGLLHELWTETKATEYQVRLELVLGDTCSRWHRDVNVLRSLVTYVGPGTMVADEKLVERGCDGAVLSVAEDGFPNQVLGLCQASAGDFTLMKGALYPGGCHGLGAAHRAPLIGRVGECEQYRIILKVDILSNFANCSTCTSCEL